MRPVIFPVFVAGARGGKRLSNERSGRKSPRGGAMFSDLHWSVQAIPFVIVGGVILTWLLGKHKEKKSTEHIFKIDN